MNCTLCGTPLTHAGQGHRCAGGPAPAVRPPARWQASYWALMATVVLYTAVVLVGVLDGPASPAVQIAASFAVFVAFVVWAGSTRRLAETYGGTVAVVRNVALTCGWLALLISYVLPMSSTAYRFAAVAAGPFMVAGLLIARNKVHQWLVEPADPAVPLPAPVPQPGPSPHPFAPVTMPNADVRPDDWNASLWDPDIQAEIERKRHRHRPPA